MKDKLLPARKGERPALTRDIVDKVHAGKIRIQRSTVTNRIEALSATTHLQRPHARGGHTGGLAQLLQDTCIDCISPGGVLVSLMCIQDSAETDQTGYPLTPHAGKAEQKQLHLTPLKEVKRDG